MKALRIIEVAYRATIEEQDDTIVWITHAITGAGGDLDVLSRGNVVHYAVAGQDASGISFGEWKQTQPPDIARDIAGLVGKAVAVSYVAAAAAARGLDAATMVDGVTPIPRATIPGLFANYD